MLENLKNYIAVRRLRRAFSPRSGFGRELWRVLQAEMPVLERKFAPARLAWGAAFSIIVFSTLGGTGAYAYTSPEVVPSHPLYNVKRGLEEIDEKVALSDAARQTARERRIAHRLAEAERLAGKDSRFERVLDDIDRELEKVFEIKNSSTRGGLMDSAELTDEKVIGNLSEIASKNTENVLPSIEQVIVKDAQRIQDNLPAVRQEDAKAFLLRRLRARQDVLNGMIVELESGQIFEDGAADGLGDAGDAQEKVININDDLDDLNESGLDLF